MGWLEERVRLMRFISGNGGWLTCQTVWESDPAGNSAQDQLMQKSGGVGTRTVKQCIGLLSVSLNLRTVWTA